MNSGRLRLLLIAAVLAAPFLAGSGLYFAGWRPESTVNHGQLISPLVALPDAEAWRGKWSLALIHAEPCSPQCLARLDELGRVRLSLAKEAERTRIASLARRPEALRALPEGSVVLVDPRGLAVMRYAPGADARGMRADLERLLKYSWSG